jgi:predicted dehydrogenase
MNNEPVRIGLIGCGSITHFIHIPGLRLSPGVVLAAACDASIEAARSTASRFGIAKSTDHYQDVIQDPDIDAVVIATPNDLHRPISLEALAAGKHVLCEKPLGLNTRECDEMVAAAQKAGKVNQVSFVYRFVPAMRYMKHLVESGAVGEIRHFRAFYLQSVPEVWLGWRSDRKQAGSGTLGDIGTHLVDFAHYLVGGMTSVSGWTKTFLPQRPMWGTHQMVDVDVDDAAGYLAEFACGATGVFEATRLAPGRGCGRDEFQSVEINGSKGSLYYYLQDPFHLQINPGAPYSLAEMFTTQVPDEFMKWHDAPRQVVDAEPNIGFRYDQAFAFTQAIRGIQPERLPDFEDGRRCQAIVDAVLEAGQTRRWVDVQN